MHTCCESRCRHRCRQERGCTEIDTNDGQANESLILYFDVFVSDTEMSGENKTNVFLAKLLHTHSHNHIIDYFSLCCSLQWRERRCEKEKNACFSEYFGPFAPSALFHHRSPRNFSLPPVTYTDCSCQCILTHDAVYSENANHCWVAAACLLHFDHDEQWVLSLSLSFNLCTTSLDNLLRWARASCI